MYALAYLLAQGLCMCFGYRLLGVELDRGVYGVLARITYTR
jgi:hypothetical protein